MDDMFSSGFIFEIEVNKKSEIVNKAKVRTATWVALIFFNFMV
jgi:hypothetical protein